MSGRLNEEIGARVRDLRTARGWSQAELADRLSRDRRKVYQTTVARMEKDARAIHRR